MTGKNCSGFDSRQSYPRQDDKNTFTKQSRMRNSAESLFSCVTNVSDTGTYEIEICEKQSRDTCSFSRRAIRSKSPVDSEVSRSDLSKYHSHSKSVRSVLPSKSDNSIIYARKPLTRSKSRLIQSYYPCFCIATLEMRENAKPKVDLVNKETNTNNKGAEYSAQASKSVSYSSVISSKKENDEFSSAVDSEKTCTGSHCSSNGSSGTSGSGAASSSESENSFQRNKKSSQKASLNSLTSKSTTTGSVDTEKSCDCTKCRYCPRESSGTYVVVSDEKKPKESQIERKPENIFQRIKTVQALELISEEKEKQWTEGVGEFKSCKCEMSRYEERLKNLENLHVSSKTAGDVKNWSKALEGESHYRSCECAATLIQFAEIKCRIEALEKLCRDTLGNTPEALKGNKEVKLRSEPVTEDGSYTEEGKSKCRMKSLSETLDEASRTTIELAKIKKRLMDLEVKMLQEKTCCTSSSQSVKNNTFGKGKKVAVNTTTTYITPPNSKLSDKEIQVIDLSGEQNRPGKAREDYGFIAENRLAAYWLMKKMNPWGRIVLRDEAIQTPSKKQMEHWSADSELCAKSREKDKKKLKKSCDRIHLCKECDFYISQKIGRIRGESLEKLWNIRKLNESLPVKSNKFGSENFNKLKKSLNLYQINTSDFLAERNPRKLSFFNETRRILEKKRKKEQKKLKLCSKCSKTNLKESVLSDEESEVQHGGRYPWTSNGKRFDKSCDSVKNRDVNVKKDSKKSFRSVRMPHQSFQIYRTQETSHSLLLNPRSSRARTFSSRHRRKMNYHEGKSIPGICPFWTTPYYPMKVLYDCHHHPFSYATSYGSWEKNTCYTVAASAVKDSMSSCSSSFKKKNRLNPFQYLRAGRKIKIPVLFEEICHSSENKLLEDKSSMSMRVVQVGVKEEGKKDLSPFKKLVRKFSHSQSMAYTEKIIPFGVSKCTCDNAIKAKRKSVERQKKTKLFSLVRRRCPP